MEKLILVTADWCASCGPIKKFLAENIAPDYDDLEVSILDIEKDGDELSAYPMPSTLPTFFRELESGILTMNGAKSEYQIRRFIEAGEVV